MKTLETLAQTERYSRHIMLPSMDLAGQERLLNSKVLVIGVGGLACAALPYLCSGGVGQLCVVDGDRVSLSNLQRQTLFYPSDIGAFKAQTAQHRLRQQNPEVTVQAINEFADADLLAELVPQYHVVLDCTDNWQARVLISDQCRNARVPLISAAAIRFEGQLCAFNHQEAAPCYRCIASMFQPAAESCLTAGIFAPVVGIMGMQQALWAMLYLSGVADLPWHQLHLFDGQLLQWRQFQIPPSPHCPHHPHSWV